MLLPLLVFKVSLIQFDTVELVISFRIRTLEKLIFDIAVSPLRPLNIFI